MNTQDFGSINQDLYWTVVERDISQLERDIIAKADIQGLGFEERSARYYSESSLGAHILGYCASNDEGVIKAILALRVF